MNPFITLLHAHDHIWQDRTYHWSIRFDTCQLLWMLAVQAALISPRRTAAQGGHGPTAQAAPALAPESLAEHLDRKSVV